MREPFSEDILSALTMGYFHNSVPRTVPRTSLYEDPIHVVPQPVLTVLSHV